MCGELGRSNVSDQCTALGSYSNKFHEKDGLRKARWVSRPELSVMLPGTLPFTALKMQSNLSKLLQSITPEIDCCKVQPSVPHHLLSDRSAATRRALGLSSFV